jgi:hypothetical protein
MKENRDVVSELKRHIRMLPKEHAFSEDDHLLMLAEMNAALAKSFTALINRKSLPQYRADSLFIKDSYRFLNQGSNESLHFVTGSEVDRKMILSRIVELNLREQNPCYARADTDAAKKALIHLSIHGYRLHGYFHIHPGTGPGATFPSSTDLNMDRLFFRGGYEPVGAVFSRDGFVRFFSSQNFNIYIYGKGVEKVDEKIYRIVDVS